jgi:hypothetical protein
MARTSGASGRHRDRYPPRGPGSDPQPRGSGHRRPQFRRDRRSAGPHGCLGTGGLLEHADGALPLENPLRVAEDAAVLDTLSGGRIELGVANGGAAIDSSGQRGIDENSSGSNKRVKRLAPAPFSDNAEGLTSYGMLLANPVPGPQTASRVTGSGRPAARGRFRVAFARNAGVSPSGTSVPAGYRAMFVPVSGTKCHAILDCARISEYQVQAYRTKPAKRRVRLPRRAPRRRHDRLRGISQQRPMAGQTFSTAFDHAQRRREPARSHDQSAAIIPRCATEPEKYDWARTSPRAITLAEKAAPRR